jgi:hypothetical protein
MGGPVRKSGLGGTGVCVGGGGGLRSGPSSFAVYPGAGLPLVRTSKDAGQPQSPIFCGLAVHRTGAFEHPCGEQLNIHLHIAGLVNT